MTQSINEQIGSVSAVKPEFHLCEVGREMFGADFMPASHDTALEQRECRFHGICVTCRPRIAHTPLRVIDSFMFVIANGTWVCSPFVGDDDIDIGADVFPDVLCERAGLNHLRMEESQIAAAFADANDNFLVVVPLASMP